MLQGGHLEHIFEKFFHLLLDKLFNVLCDHFDLLPKVVRTTVNVLAGLLNDDLDFSSVWDFKIVEINWKSSDLRILGLVATLADDIAIVSRTTTVPGKVL
jgi:hypothetical protein